MIHSELIRAYISHHPIGEHQFLLGTRWLQDVGELPDDELDRVLSDPRRAKAGEEIRDMGEEP